MVSVVAARSKLPAGALPPPLKPSRTIMQPFLVSIEGNIGSGKSTLMRELRARNPSWHFVDEPVESWMNLKNASGETLLEVFYKDKRRWAYTFQNTALLTRILALREAVAKWRANGCTGSPIFVTERCIDTDARVFAKMLGDDGDIDALEMTLYQTWFDAFKDQVPAPAAFLHVDTPVTICDERINRRARHGESGTIPIEYLDQLDSAHFRWLRDYGLKTPVLRVDNASKDQTRIEIVEEWVKSRWLESVD
jgi:deoxyguanosine kinase